MMNDLWRQQVKSMLDALKAGGAPLPNSVLAELLGEDLYDQLWQTQFEAEDEDQARYERAAKVGVPASVKGYLSTRLGALTASKKLQQLQKRQAAKVALQQKHIAEIVKFARELLEKLSDEDRALLWPDDPNALGKLAERLPDLLPGHLVGDPYRPEARVRAQIAILETALATDAPQS